MVQLFAGLGVVLLLVSWLPFTPDLMAILTGTLGAFVWGAVAYGLLNLETTGGATATEPALALVAAAALVVTALPALVDPFELVQPDDTGDPYGKL